MLRQCLGDLLAMLRRLRRCLGNAREMLGQCSGDGLIRTIGTNRSILRAKSDLFESLGRLRSREYLEPFLDMNDFPES